MFSNVLKAHILKGAPVGNQNAKGHGKGKASPGGSGRQTSESNTPDSGSKGKGTAFPHQSFHKVGEAYGGKKITPNSVMHNTGQDAANHADFIHGHLEDSGFKQGKGDPTGSLGSREYWHSDGSWAKVNSSERGGKGVITYDHKPPESAPERPSKDKAQSAAKKKLPAAATPKKQPSSTPNKNQQGSGAIRLPPSGLKIISSLSSPEQNDHGGAIIQGARMLGLHDLASEVTKIRDQHKKAGPNGLSDDLRKRRDAAYQKMMDHAKKNLSEGDFEKFHGSF